MSFRDRFIAAFVESFAKRSATTLVFLILALIGASFALLTVLPWVASIPIAVVLVVAAILAFRIFFRRLYVIYPRRPGTYEVLSKHFIYKTEVVASKRIVTIRRYYKICFLRDGVDTIREPYLWTGSDPAAPRAIAGSCTVSAPYTDTIWTIVDLHLPRTYSKGEEFEFELEWVLDDTDHASRPFVSAPTNEPTRRLTFDLFLPETPRVKDVTIQQRRSIDSLTPFKTEEIPFRDGHATWDKRDPGKYFYYCLKWRYEDE